MAKNKPKKQKIKKASIYSDFYTKQKWIESASRIFDINKKTILFTMRLNKHTHEEIDKTSKELEESFEELKNTLIFGDRFN
jgi:hypothetical protein